MDANQDEPSGTNDGPVPEELGAYACSTDNLVFGCDAGSRLIWWNPALERLSGQSSDRLRDRPLTRLVLPDQQARAETLIEQALASGHAQEELDLVDAEGGAVPYHVEIRAVGGGRLVMVAHDISECRQMLRALRRSEARFRSAAEAALDAIVMIDARGRVTLWNPTAERMFGYRREEMLGRDLHRTLAPARHQAAYREGFEGFRETGEGPVVGRIVQLEACHKDGHEVPVELSLTAVCQDGEWHALGILRDISERVRQERALERANRALRTLSGVNTAIVHAGDEFALLERVCRVIVQSGGYELAWVGFPQNDTERTIRIAAHAGDDHGYLDQLQVSWGDNEYGRGPAGRALREAKPDVIRYVESSADFSPWQAAASERGYRSVCGLPLQIPAHPPIGVLLIYSSEGDAFDEEEIDLLREAASDLAYGIRERRLREEHRKASQQLGYLNLHDPVTDLANRSYFLRALDFAATQAEQHGRTSAVIMLDVNGFRLVNDSLGHTAGDAVLREIGHRLTRQLRGSDTVARIGSDGFAVLVTLGEYGPLPRDAARDDAEEVVRKLLGCFDEPFRVGGDDTYLTAGFGISLLPLDESTPPAVLAQADRAMHQVKRSGGSAYQFWRPELEIDRQGALSLGARLHRASREGGFVLYYQPIVKLDTGEVVGAEALIRWPQTDGAMISPAHFIPLAEELGLIKPIGQWVLESACEQLLEWQAHAPDFRMCVNLSPIQVVDRNATRRLLKTIDALDLPSGALEFEITEGLLIGNLDDLAPLLRELQERRIGLALDDFGTGYSSLTRLKQLPLDTLKIDKSLVDEMGENQDEATMIRAVVDMARGLAMRSLAEGIETRTQWEFLQRAGCGYGQGYHFSRPLPAEEFEALLRADRLPWHTSGN
ncbi:MAG: sensor domain-containing protein [Pseudomonadota bacterium]